MDMSDAGALLRIDLIATRARQATAALRRHPVATDAAVAAAFAIAALVSLSATFELLRQDPTLDTPARPPLVLALLLVTLPLALRRRFPLSVAVVVIVAFVVGRLVLAPDLPGLSAWEGIVSVWACWLALYSAVVHGRGVSRTTLVVAVLSVVLLGEVVREIYGDALLGLPLNQGFQLAYNVVILALPLVLGAAVRSSRARRRELIERAVELQREREENARRAVLEERVRIARELHDVVAHHVSVMGVQAGAARRVMGRQPEKAEEALGSIESSSRQAVAELHRLLGFLRQAGQSDDLAPQPALSQLPALVARAGQGPLAVELTVEGDPRPLPPTLEVSAYRVVQEALTNALRHSGGTTALVRVGYRPAALEIEVHDDGPGRAPARPANLGGHGLIGMRERVGLHGGDLRAGPDPRGGFAVRATFPLNGGPQ
jgi:signal transduction histidine kinase